MLQIINKRFMTHSRMYKDSLKKHEKGCRFRPIKCPIAGDYYSYCNTTVDKVVNHIRQDHQYLPSGAYLTFKLLCSEISKYEKYFQARLGDFGGILGVTAGYRNTPKDVWGGYIYCK